MKKLFSIIILGGFFIPLIVLAAGNIYRVTDYFPEECGGAPVTYTVAYDGIVPCGECLDIVSIITPGGQVYVWRNNECDQGLSRCATVPANSVKFIPCTICHIFIMADGIIDFILLKIVPPMAAILLIISGIAFYQAGASPEKFSWAKSVLISVIIGLVIIYTSWIIVNSVILNAMGIADWVGFGEGWFQISCEIKL